MKHRIISILSLLILVLVIVNTGAVFAQSEHKPITQELIQLVEKDPRIGDMLGYFLFGGSDIIMLFQKDAQFEMTAPMENKVDYENILMGEEYGKMKPQPKTNQGYWWIVLTMLVLIVIATGIVLVLAKKHESA